MFKQILAASLFIISTIANDDCQVDRQVQCVDQFKQALPYCKKASQSKGSDAAADLNCLKYAYQMQRQCWPCICYIATKEKLNIKGC